MAPVADGPPVLAEGKPTIVSTWMCPFAQRSLLALNAGGAPYSHHELGEGELYSKPAWFTDLNPAGLVPTLAWLHKGERRVLTESLIINEFVAEGLDCPNPLLPADPFERARARLVIDRFGSKAVPQFYALLLRKDEAERAAARAALDAQLEWLAAEGLSAKGPWALEGWGAPSLVDCAVLPFLLRLPVLAHYRGYAPPPAASDRLAAYVEAARAHPSVAATMVHPAGHDYASALIESYAKYADGTANSQVAREIKSKAAATTTK
ncbi:hypothetical protein Rsub_08630 [Raphidocelis subcapitata]|uniref:Glutathione S-transferase n=1 Tax=Raphidocelis subcapitata TaxID=307507 RepID=A0A2V0P712_9CHLO|nr:hypothetical protein Rsub_08630 [Raphidocelis subcapitata]|eukprot:GBF95648.1 hypothetical protein Rsub_08630 [Raphidocelis subcapitata]